MTEEDVSEALIIALRAASNQLAGQTTTYNQNTRHQLLVEQDANLLAPVEEHLRAMPDVKAISELCVSSLGRRNQVQLSLRKIAAHLVSHSLIASPEDAFSGLREIIATNEARATITAIISGVTLDREITLLPRMRIRPFVYNDAPPGLMSFQRPEEGALIDRLRPSPHSLLSIDIDYEPVFEKVNHEVGLWPEEVIGKLLTIATCLSIVAEHEVAVLEMWIDSQDERLPADTGRILFRNPAWGSGPTQDPVALDIHDAQEFLQQIQNVPKKKDRDAIEMAMTRLNRARRAPRLEDQAIELGIAAEVLLMHDTNGSNQEISFKLSARGAYLLENEPEQRLLVFKQISDIYNRRSKAVHKGTLNHDRSDVADWMKSLNDCTLVGRIIRTIVARGAFPQWSRLVMGGGYLNQ